MLPFDEKKISEGLFIRKFSADLDAEDLYWHKDKEDRIISKLSGDGWFYQEDNCMPVPIGEQEIYINKNTWHRIIKGSSDLVLKVAKLKWAE